MLMGRFAAAFLSFAAICGSALAGRETERHFELADFSAIEVGGAYELEVRVGEDYSVSMSGDQDEMARVEAAVADGVLHLKSGKRVRGDHNSVEVVVTLPALSRIEVSGVADAQITGVDADNFKVTLSGVGEVNVEGRCGALKARVSGVGELDASQLHCRTADINVSGVGEASAYARESARAEVSGMGEISIYGRPKVVDKRGGFLSEITVH